MMDLGGIFRQVVSIAEENAYLSVAFYSDVILSMFSLLSAFYFKKFQIHRKIEINIQWGSDISKETK